METNHCSIPFFWKYWKIFIWVTHNYRMNRGMTHPIKDGWCLPVCSRSVFDATREHCEQHINHHLSLCRISIQSCWLLITVQSNHEPVIFSYSKRHILEWDVSVSFPSPNRVWSNKYVSHPLNMCYLSSRNNYWLDSCFLHLEIEAHILYIFARMIKILFRGIVIKHLFHQDSQPLIGE